MSDFKITSDAPNLAARFERAGNAGIDIQDMLAEIGGALRASAIDRFASETAPGGVKWKPLAKRTAQAKKSTKILVNRGFLRNSINAQVSGSVLEVGSPVKYAGVHQFGAVISMSERSQTIKLGINRRKQEDGKFKQSFGFIRADRKTGESRQVQVGAHRIVIPARPYLDVKLVEDMPRVTEAIDRRLRHALALGENADLGWAI
jgi:phage virion morphogenesis protein